MRALMRTTVLTAMLLLSAAAPARAETQVDLAAVIAAQQQVIQSLTQENKRLADELLRVRSGAGAAEAAVSLHEIFTGKPWPSYLPKPDDSYRIRYASILQNAAAAGNGQLRWALGALMEDFVRRGLASYWGMSEALVARLASDLGLQHHPEYRQWSDEMLGRSRGIQGGQISEAQMYDSGEVPRPPGRF